MIHQPYPHWNGYSPVWKIPARTHLYNQPQWGLPRANAHFYRDFIIHRLGRVHKLPPSATSPASLTPASWYKQQQLLQFRAERMALSEHVNHVSTLSTLHITPLSVPLIPSPTQPQQPQLISKNQYYEKWEEVVHKEYLRPIVINAINNNNNNIPQILGQPHSTHPLHPPILLSTQSQSIPSPFQSQQQSSSLSTSTIPLSSQSMTAGGFNNITSSPLPTSSSSSPSPTIDPYDYLLFGIDLDPSDPQYEHNLMLFSDDYSLNSLDGVQNGYKRFAQLHLTHLSQPGPITTSAANATLGLFGPHSHILQARHHAHLYGLDYLPLPPPTTSLINPPQPKPLDGIGEKFDLKQYHQLREKNVGGGKKKTGGGAATANKGGSGGATKSASHKAKPKDKAGSSTTTPRGGKDTKGFKAGAGKDTAKKDTTANNKGKKKDEKDTTKTTTTKSTTTKTPATANPNKTYTTPSNVSTTQLDSITHAILPVSDIIQTWTAKMLLHQEKYPSLAPTRKAAAPGLPAPITGYEIIQLIPSAALDPTGGSQQSQSQSNSQSPDSKSYDQQPFCFCRTQSVGEMVGCESESCPFEWFHYQCVGISTAPRGTWYCLHCIEKLYQKQADAVAAQQAAKKSGSTAPVPKKPTITAKTKAQGEAQDKYIKAIGLYPRVNDPGCKLLIDFNNYYNYMPDPNGDGGSLLPIEPPIYTQKLPKSLVERMAKKDD